MATTAAAGTAAPSRAPNSTWVGTSPMAGFGSSYGGSVTVPPDGGAPPFCVCRLSIRPTASRDSSSTAKWQVPVSARLCSASAKQWARPTATGARTVVPRGTVSAAGVLSRSISSSFARRWKARAPSVTSAWLPTRCAWMRSRVGASPVAAGGSPRHTAAQRRAAARPRPRASERTGASAAGWVVDRRIASAGTVGAHAARWSGAWRDRRRLQRRGWAPCRSAPTASQAFQDRGQRHSFPRRAHAAISTRSTATRHRAPRARSASTACREPWLRPPPVVFAERPSFLAPASAPRAAVPRRPWAVLRAARPRRPPRGGRTT
jgi:hypothetical protein